MSNLQWFHSATSTMMHTRLTEMAEATAKRVHKDQKEDDGQPYFHHVQLVVASALILFRDYSDEIKEKVLCVAYLHDTLEDTDLTYAEIELDFGKEIADAVLTMTRRKGETYEEMIVRVARNVYACAAKIADLTANLARRDAERFHKHAKYLWAIDYLRNYHE